MIDSTLNNANILLVDDQLANVEVLEGLLELQGYTNVESTTDPRQVLSLFKSFHPDLILLDLMMPHLNGFEVMAQLKNIISTDTYIPILILTADITFEAKQHALEYGANDFLTKPFDLVEVALRIKNLLYTKYLHQQMQMQNQILEQKVKDRTRELEKTNNELVVAIDKAESSDRLKTAFLQNISHEIRTPLNGILGFSDLLVDPAVADVDKKELISMIQTSSVRLLNTIEDYVSIAMIISGNMVVNYETVDVNAVLIESRFIFKDKAEIKGLGLNFLCSTDTAGVTVETDLKLFKRVLFHLLDNAIKFTKEGLITIGYDVKPDFIEFYVKDTGIGIDEKVKDQLFDIFMQEDLSLTRGHQGSGLGLSIVKGLLILLGGNIRMESVKGEGSVFYFTLPIKNQEN